MTATLPTVNVTATVTPNYTDVQPENYNDELNKLDYLVRSYLSQTRTAVPVKVIAVHGASGVYTVDVQPMIMQLLGNGNGKPHNTIYGIPVRQYQGGSSAVVIAPVANDLGEILCNDRDITNFVLTGANSSKSGYLSPQIPPSKRQCDFADAVYIGAFLNPAPTTYISISSSDIEIRSPNVVNINSNNINLNGNVTVTGTVTANGHRIDETHKHSGVTIGLSNTGAVT